MNLLFLFLLSVFSGYTVSTEQLDSSAEHLPYFKGKGLSPAWNLSIYPDSILFESAVTGFTSFRRGHRDPVKELGRKTYELSAGDGQSVKIIIADGSCKIAGSNESFVYSATVEISEQTDADPKIFSGCGHYLTDRRLEGLWLVKQINGTDVDSLPFNGSAPSLDIRPTRNSFSGFAGCNNINGRIFSERTILRFTDVVATQMSCLLAEGEEQFLKALSFSTQFEIDDQRLILSNPMQETLILELSVD